jgi:hypothetical protein
LQLQRVRLARLLKGGNRLVKVTVLLIERMQLGAKLHFLQFVDQGFFNSARIFACAQGLGRHSTFDKGLLLCHHPVTDNCRDLCQFQCASQEIEMSLKNHLNELMLKHRALETELAEAMAHPATSDSQLADIKRRKLKVKDEISRIEKDMAKAA